MSPLSQVQRIGKLGVVSDPAEPPDDVLVERLLTGDGEAFAMLYRRHLPTVVAFLHRQTRDRETTADLTAEVFAAAFVSAGRFEGRDGSALGWLLGIARNKLLESLRRGRVESSARRRLGLEPVVLEDADLERVEVMASSPEALLALAALPEPYREAVAGRVLDEEDYASLAERLHCSESVVRQRVSRGLRALRRELEEPA